MALKFKSVCGKCKCVIRSNNGGASWRHEVRPEQPHHAYATGTMIQI